MPAETIDGKRIALEIRAEVAERAERLKKRGTVPCLAVLLAGRDPASASYVAGKRKALAEAGMADKSIVFDESVTEERLLSAIEGLNRDDSVHGILAQLPLPPQIDPGKVIMAIDPRKDVDGFHPVNMGNLAIGKPSLAPCTPSGIIELLRRMNVRTDGAFAVIIGRSNIVGKPLALMMSSKDVNATVALCHSGTKNLAEIASRADILVAAAGRANFVGEGMVKEGAVVIDVGVNRVPDPSKKSGFALTGDVDFEAARRVASMITPVPGGVGPMTIAMLMRNTLAAAEMAAR